MPPGAEGMNRSRIIGMCVLAAVWVWLVAILIKGSGLTLRTILVAAMSGIIIFVPLWKKYFKRTDK